MTVDKYMCPILFSENSTNLSIFYTFKPVQPTEKFSDDDVSPVHFAYSITLLHQSCVLHCVIPGIPWNQAKAIRPLFKLYGENIQGSCV